MRTRSKVLVIVALMGAFVLALGGVAFAEHAPGHLDPNSGGVDLPAVEVGPPEAVEAECTEADEPLPISVPAIDGCTTADGRTILDLPGAKVVGPATPDAPAVPDRPGAPRELPTTGANVGDIFALGLAALSGGGVLLRRLRLSLAS